MLIPCDWIDAKLSFPVFLLATVVTFEYSLLDGLLFCVSLVLTRRINFLSIH